MSYWSVVEDRKFGSYRDLTVSQEGDEGDLHLPKPSKMHSFPLSAHSAWAIEYIACPSSDE